ncbi:Las1-like-domain-containing protein [Mycena pura]|uniref:Las1-like-domain-containing protein n=1 Tax=Mycena pura TaxID=153505 RepID=A0AAD6YQ16_9AGAR|nr:Las1-like-domain-containing protein [Mycena pura]
MRLPRRVPWTSIAELDQLCAWIYTDETDLDFKIKAINRLSAWRAITPLPHALDSTLALLCVLVQDTSDPQPTSYLYLRHSYAAAMLRLVNGFVDPLQRGMYARSIASIANQLGLPSWLVELRHASTHEDLPSLELLRQAARESMTWLLHNYFLPTINPSTAPALTPAPLRPLSPVLKEYKSLRKIVTRDASLKSQYQHEINSVLRDIERWIAEVTVSANVAAGDLGWGNTGNIDQSAKERWALEQLCDALLEKGALVPLSKKKRVFPTQAFLPPPSAVSVWAPLLTELYTAHADFPVVLAHRIVTHLLADVNATRHDVVPITVDPTYDACLARWALWVLDSLATDCDVDSESRKDVVAALITGLGPGGSPDKDVQAATALLHALCAGNAEMDEAVSLLLQQSRPSLVQWTPDDISVMHERLTALMALPEPDSTNADTPSSMDGPVSTEATLAPGWRLLDSNSNWNPSPMGVYVAGG